MSKPDIRQERRKLFFEEDVDWPEGSLEDLENYIDYIRSKYTHVQDLKVESYWWGYEDCDYRVVGWVWETDEQMERRIQDERIVLEELEEQEEKRKKREEKFRLEEVANLKKRLAELGE